MGQFFKMFFASFLAMFIAGIVLIGFFVAVVIGVTKSVASDEEKGTTIASRAVLVIDMEKEIHEQGQRNSFAQFTGDDSYEPGLYDLVKAIKKAKTDDKVKGIVIKTSFSPNGMATMQELRNALLDFKGNDKFIYAYGEIIPQKSYYLASVADSIFLNPAGFPELKGLSTELAFFKGTLQKLEVEPEIFYAGKFKSATEPFRADKMSEPNRQQISAFQEDFWNEYLQAYAGHARVDTATIQQLTKAGAVQFAADALRYHIVDKLYYWDQVEASIRGRLGKNSKTSGKDKEDEDDDKINYTDISKYAAGARASTGKGTDRIAVIFAERNIVDGESTNDRQIASVDICETISKIRKNDRIDAVVLRINSPGGSALASEVILRELQLLQKEKPLIVSMGDLAASGGYYIACAADSIFAMPTTITGSIGVFSMLFNTEKLLNNKLGITMDGVKNAPYADFPSATKPLTADESARMQRIVDTIYATFKRRVSIGRRIADADVDSFAQGRVWSGNDALAIRLVDGLGGLDRALAAAAKKAGLDDYKVVTYPDPSDKFQSMLRRMGNSNAGAAAISMAIKNELGSDYDFYTMLKELKSMNGKAQMAMPFRMTVK